MSIKNKLNNESIMSTAKLFSDQYRQKGLLPDIDMKLNDSSKLAKNLSAIDDKALPGYDCDVLPKQNWLDAWVNVWGKMGSEVAQDMDEQLPLLRV